MMRSMATEVLEKIVADRMPPPGTDHGIVNLLVCGYLRVCGVCWAWFPPLVQASVGMAVVPVISFQVPKRWRISVR